MPFTHFNGEKGNIIERITCDDVVSTERANSLLFYRSQSKFCHIYFHFKYHNHPEVAVEMGRMMANELKDTDFFNGIDCMVPVPLSTQRFKKRGYNQSQFLAKFVAKELGLPMRGCLKKIRETPKQSTLNASARRENLKGAFAPRKNCPAAGKTVLLVDDVLTTGSTMDECARVLRKNGAKAIYCTTCAITKPE